MLGTGQLHDGRANFDDGLGWRSRGTCLSSSSTWGYITWAEWGDVHLMALKAAMGSWRVSHEFWSRTRRIWRQTRRLFVYISNNIYNISNLNLFCLSFN